MTVDIHPGEVIHSMDHLVLDLGTSTGSIAYLTIYSLGLMRDVGSGRVALLRTETADGVVDRCFGETVELAERMQQRLRRIRAEGGAAPSVGLDHDPLQADIRRVAISEPGDHWLVESSDHVVSASWRYPEPAFWLSAPAPSFHPSHDYVTTMVSYGRADLVVDGLTIAGEPYEHADWEQRLGRPFSSCHAALSETAIGAA